MRSINASLFMTLDGVVEAPETWQPAYFNNEIGAVIGQALATSGGLLLGRRTYDEWAAFWPTADNPMAPMMNQMPKYVVSNSLNEATWENSTVISGDVVSEIARLKEEDGGDLLISGSATLVRSLLEAGLLDELQLLVHPLALGDGGHLVDLGSGPFALTLVESQQLGNGVLNLKYRPVR